MSSVRSGKVLSKPKAAIAKYEAKKEADRVAEARKVKAQILKGWR